jgi:glyoxylase-like metal-dependent hydrolase (beta-lactamase superfamily II)
VVDSPVLPDELELLPAVAAQAGFTVVGLLATHADWDHVLAPLAFGDGPLGVAESTAARLRDQPGDAQRGLRAFDEEHYVSRPRPLALSGWQELPVPGRCELGSADLELVATPGHTADGMAIWAPWAGTLLVGDYLSPVEIPMVGYTVDAYLETLTALEPLVGGADWVVPGHGEPLDGERALAILREDRGYVEALRERGADAPLPLARRTAAQRAIHRANVDRL